MLFLKENSLETCKYLSQFLEIGFTKRSKSAKIHSELSPP